jgi:hypothetical protein
VKPLSQTLGWLLWDKGRAGAAFDWLCLLLLLLLLLVPPPWLGDPMWVVP